MINNSDDKSIKTFLQNFPKLLLARLDLKRKIANYRQLIQESTAVVIAGKAAAALAETIENEAGPPKNGFIIAPLSGKPPFGKNIKSNTWLSYYGEHPLPGHNSWQAATELLHFLDRICDKGPLLVIMSGGASAMLAAPPPDIPHSDKIVAHSALIRSGLSIEKINTVRRHISSVKGGALLRRLLSRNIHTHIHVLALSDVPNNQPHDIGSGPFCPDPTTFSQALQIALEVPNFPASALNHLKAGVAGLIPETLKEEEIPPGAWSFELIGYPTDALTETISLLGNTVTTSDAAPPSPCPWNLSGDPAKWAEHFLSAIESDKTAFCNRWWVATGETEVAIPASIKPGSGGRASTLVVTLGLALAEANFPFTIGVLATDGRDGSSCYAGGWLTSADLASPSVRAAARTALSCYDTATFLASIGRAWPGFSAVTNLGDLLLAKVEYPKY